MPRRRAPARGLPLAAAGAAAAAGRRCVFLHGAGQTYDGPPTTGDVGDGDYWGGTANILAYVGGLCTETWFAHTDTVNRRWDDPRSIARYCDAATGASTGGGAADGVVRDTVVITHSMGNNLFAQGLLTGTCSLDAGTSRWYSLSAPWRGSKGCDVLETVCASGTGALRDLANLMDTCNGSQINPAYQSLMSTDPGLANGSLVSIAAAHVTGALCGTDPTGLVSEYSLPLQALANVVEYGEDNDGMVPVSSCRIPDRSYTASWGSAWYLPAVNHADGTARNGNGDGGKAARQPAQWLASRAAGGPPPAPTPSPSGWGAGTVTGADCTASDGDSCIVQVPLQRRGGVRINRVSFTVAASAFPGCGGAQAYAVAALCDGGATWASAPQAADDGARCVVLGNATNVTCTTFAAAIHNENSACAESYSGVSVDYAVADPVGEK